MADVKTPDQINLLCDYLDKKNISGMYQSDLLLTWDKSRDEIDAVLLAAGLLKAIRDRGISVRVFDSGIAVSIFRDKSTRTRFSFLSAANMLGLAVQDLDETKSQIAHGETVRETANMISFLAEAIGIRDDMYLGAGHTYMEEVSGAVEEGYKDGILPQLPTLVNLQCDIDHPTQSLSDLLHLVNHFKVNKPEDLKGKKIVMSWAYSPSYGKPLSVPQGIIGLMTRFGMDVTLAYPEDYHLIPEVEKLASDQAKENGGNFTITNSMQEAFKEADIVYPKSWAPYSVMQERTELLRAGDMSGLDALEKRCLDNNKKYMDWECTDSLMKTTNDALYMHCLPADISGVSCERGEVQADVFECFRKDTYRQAGYKPYIIAASIFLAKFPGPAEKLKLLLKKAVPRVF
ncbi:MAG: knotted carbamoyltransferase YgeW [Spirochaetes bacterium]|nr:knotted carbamoyltransferase YgeW [Spirochaetota bacterium]